MFRRSGRDPAVPDGSSRRQFLRRAGVTGALSAAVIGCAEVVGLSSAFASTKHPARPRYRVQGGASPDICTGYCNYTYTPYKCNGGKACPSGQCCFAYSCAGTCGTSSGHTCYSHACSNFSTCCH
jgi:hypothetical protein